MKNVIVNLASLENDLIPIIAIIKKHKVICWNGEMGAGKTTIIAKICQLLGSTDEKSSPTFAILNEYNCPNDKIYHFDLYRLKSIVEALDIGIEEYLDSGHYCMIEWPEIIKPLLPENALFIEITAQADKSRILQILST